MRIFSLPKWRVTRWLSDTGTGVPEHVKTKLIASLYSTMPIFFGGAINTLAVAGLITWRMPTPLFIGWFVFEAVICALRLILLIIGHRRADQGRSTPTDFLIILAVLWAMGIGFGTFASVTSGDWVVASLACLSAAAMVGGICFRNFAAPRLVATMILIVLGPCMIAGVMSGEPILLIMLFQIPMYVGSMAVAAYQFNRMLVATMQAERENDRRATHDPLTALPNRAGLARALRERLKGDPISALFYLDLDGFKAVNDRYGHAAGDRLLRLVAQDLSSGGADDRFVARIGGDEFVILAGFGVRNEAEDFAQALIARITGQEYQVGNGAAKVGLSIGIAFQAEHPRDLPSLLAAADEALYQAKAAGRSRFAIAPSSKRRAPRAVRAA